MEAAQRISTAELVRCQAMTRRLLGQVGGQDRHTLIALATMRIDVTSEEALAMALLLTDDKASV